MGNATIDWLYPFNIILLYISLGDFGKGGLTLWGTERLVQNIVSYFTKDESNSLLEIWKALELLCFVALSISERNIYWQDIFHVSTVLVGFRCCKRYLNVQLQITLTVDSSSSSSCAASTDIPDLLSPLFPNVRHLWLVFRATSRIFT